MTLALYIGLMLLSVVLIAVMLSAMARPRTPQAPARRRPFEDAPARTEARRPTRVTRVAREEDDEDEDDAPPVRRRTAADTRRRTADTGEARGSRRVIEDEEDEEEDALVVRRGGSPRQNRSVDRQQEAYEELFSVPRRAPVHRSGTAAEYEFDRRGSREKKFPGLTALCVLVWVAAAAVLVLAFLGGHGA